ncbi:RNA-binding domain-containing protein [Curvibacter lanceolatus]|uniref:RNA-binding domain-containing protein n=1 Tax=Curvibacter lanceolatus TaxID=86182 RepID=UPI00036C38E4|nr:RNA-binding domain-containing protein [Curvibacter lanceolatus]
MSIPEATEIIQILDQLDHHIADDLEGQYLDFKPSLGPKEDLKVACEYAVCFSNAGGGVVVFGVADKVKGRAQAIQGCKGHDLDVFRRGIYDGTSPGIDAEVFELQVPEGTGNLLVMRVAEGLHKPYGTAAGLFKQRISKNCMPLDPSAFQHAQVRTAALDWSGAVAQGLTLQDLDPLQIERARQILRTKAPSSGLLELPEASFLQGLEAMRDGRVTHTGMLLFARREVLAAHCPQAQFHYVLHDSETTVARNDIDRLPLLEAVERMEQVFVGPLNPEREVELGLFKVRIPQFPVEGVREAVLNALTHRDYLNPGEILIRHSAKELVVTSPGGFVAGITPENILRHEAVPRNRTLANALVKLRLVESSGVGRRRIFRSALIYGKRRPLYQTDGFSVTLRMFNRETHDELVQLVARLDAQGAEVSLDHLLVLDTLMGQSFIDVAEVAEVLQLQKDEAKQVVEAMCQPPLDLLERKGHTAAATYHLAKGVAKTLKGKAAYTRTRGLNPVRYAEMVKVYLADHQRIDNAQLRDLLGLGESPSASVEASRYLKKWSSDDGFLVKQVVRGKPFYTLR